MPHKLIPIEKVRVQEGYNDLIRTPKEVANNAKEVAQFMETQGDNPELFPIRFVEIDKEMFTRNHATLLAAQQRGWTHIYAVKSPHEPGSTADYLDLLMSNNSGHPVGRIAQGRLYKELRDGLAEDDKEVLAKIEPGSEVPWKRAPMTEQEIGDACKPVYSAEHVRQCIVLAESSPEIQELMENGSVSANIVVTARGWAKEDEGKQLKILKAALRNARENGSDKATKKHLDAVKSDFVKLKAAGGKEEKAPATGPSSPATGSESPSNSKGAETTSETPPQEVDTETENLFAKGTTEVLEEGSKKNKKLLGALATFFSDTEALEKLGVTISLTVEEAEILSEEVVKLVKNAEAVF